MTHDGIGARLFEYTTVEKDYQTIVSPARLLDNVLGEERSIILSQTFNAFSLKQGNGWPNFSCARFLFVKQDRMKNKH